MQETNRFSEYVNRYEPHRELDNGELKILAKEYITYSKYKKTTIYKIYKQLLKLEKIQEWQC